MRWREVIANAPNAYKALCDYRIGENWREEGWKVEAAVMRSLSPIVWEPDGSRAGRLVEDSDQLYEFFDSHDIYLTVGASSQEVSMSGVKYYYGYGMSGHGVGISKTLFGRYETRKEAQRTMFFKAFEVLERKLNGE